MKLQATATTAFFPAAFAAASISLALLLLPGAAVPAPSSGVAPALKLVAGEVVAAVQAPVRVVARAHHPKHAAVSSAIPVTSQLPSASVPRRPVPAHRRRADHQRVLPHRAVTRKPVTTNLVPSAPSSPVTEHGHGKAKAWGHLKKLAQKSTPALAAPAPAPLHGGHGKARGHSAAAPHGPPAVPPGQAKKASGTDRGAAPRGHGGAR
jgi:hypothetical protein